MNPVYNAANKKLLLFGVERSVLLGAMLLAVLVFYLSGLIAALVVFGICFAGARVISREDAKMAEVLIASAKLSRIYDSAAKQ